MTATPPNIYTVSHIKVTISGVSDPMDTLLFNSCKPPSWTIDAPTHLFHGDNQMPFPVVASVQRPTYGTMTLTQGWDKNHVMATWRALMESNKELKDKWKQVDVTFYGSDGTTAFAGWHADDAILTAYDHSPSDAASNGVLIVTATLTAVTQWHQTDGSSQITAP